MIATQPHFVTAVRERVGEVVVGQDVVVERMMIALLTGGHLLLLGVPGTAKTLMVNTVAKAVALKFGRVQFTIDMLPSDILGSELLDQASGEFRTHKGPVFTNLLLADEINRAAPKVQSALLEAMQERKVTIGNASHPLPTPFLVIATQNPVEQAGTFELPEAQLDRFMLCHRIGYPTPDQEETVLRRQLGMGLKHVDGGAVPKTAFDMISDEPVCGLPDLIAAMETVQKVHVSDVFMKHCVELVRLTREHPAMELGCSPRAALAIVQAARARAFVMERDFVTPEDLFELAEDVVLHRIRLSYEALAEGRKPEDVLEEILHQLG
ncbi:AAA family ATPase [Haloferula rosea]|uniref:MoxR family ATPase n=1 Tax=Haloferula rosea TaxID=490093 RepID=A0A934RC20_9BACT|nr:MoxR family ATPase [Haloferula rosea]MBK1825705.1 MoxR family ATPase [Haloferula rosea]